MSTAIRQRIGRTLATAAAVITIGVCLSSCAGSRYAAETPQPSSTASESCSVAMAHDWDHTRGPDTPVGAVEEILASFKSAQESLPADAPRDEVDSMTDPVRLRVAIRGLEALSLEAREAVVSKETGTVAIEAKAPDGSPLAYALVKQAADGGYRVSDFSAIGSVDDDPTCRK